MEWNKPHNSQPYPNGGIRRLSKNDHSKPELSQKDTSSSSNHHQSSLYPHKVIQTPHESTSLSAMPGLPSITPSNQGSNVMNMPVYPTTGASYSYPYPAYPVYQEGSHLAPQIESQTTSNFSPSTSKEPRRKRSVVRLAPTLVQPKATAKRSRLGCTTCRQRKKRCCETKPKCTECTRLKLNCIWPVPGTEHKNKSKELKEEENVMYHEVYGKIKVLRGIVDYKSDEAPVTNEFEGDQ